MKKYLYQKIAIFIAILSSQIDNVFAESLGAKSFNYYRGYDHDSFPRRVEEPPSTGFFFSNNDSLGILWRFIIPFIFLILIIWNLIIYPYRYFRAYKKLTPEIKQNTYPFFTIEKHIAHGVLLTAYLYLIILIGKNSYFSTIEKFTKEYIFSIIMVHYVIILIYGVYIFRKGFKDSGKKLIKGIHIFLLINLGIYYSIIYGIEFLISN